MLLRSIWMGLTLFVLFSYPSFPSFAQTQQKSTKNHRMHRTNALGNTQRQKVIAYALQHNLALRAFQARIQRARAKVMGLSVFPNNPTLSGGGGVQFPADRTPVSGQMPPILPRAEAAFSLALPVGGRWEKAQRLASSQLFWLQRQAKVQQFQLSLNVHHLLNQVAVALWMRDKRQAIFSFFQKLEGLVQERIRHGSATQLELLLAQSSRLQAQQAVLSATLRYRLLRQRLKTLIGWTSSAKMPWRTNVVPAFAPLPQKSHLLSKGLRGHILIRLAEASIDQAKAALALSKARAVPDLTISLEYALEDNNHIVRGSVSIPLPFFWRNQSSIGQDHAQLRHARLLLARQRFFIRQRIVEAYMQYQTSLKMLGLFEKQFQTITIRSQLIEQGLRQGSFTVFQVLAAQRSILQSQILNLQNIQKAHRSYIRLCQAMGMLPVYEGTLLR